MSTLPMRPKDLELALLVIVVWGVNFAVIKIGVIGVPPMLLGALRFMLAALSWACGNIVTRLVSEYGPMNQLAFVVWASLVPPLQFLVMSLWLEGPETMVQSLTHLTAGTLGAVAYLAWMATLIGYGFWTYLMSRYPIHRVAPFTLLVPLVSLSTGWMVFGEALGPLHLAGGAMLMVGLLMNVFGQSLLQPLLKRWTCKT